MLGYVLPFSLSNGSLWRGEGRCKVYDLTLQGVEWSAQLACSKKTRVLMAAHQSGISSALGLTSKKLPQLGLRSKNVSLCRSEDRHGGGKQDALRRSGGAV